MRRNIRVFLKVLLVWCLIASGSVLLHGHAEAAIPRVFSEPEMIDDPVQTVRLFDGAFGTEDGHPVMYSTVPGSPAKFNVVNLVTNEVLRVIDLEGAYESWSHITAKDGTVYIATSPNGALYQYSPVTKEVKKFEFGIRSLIGLSTDDEGHIYGGTYPGGRAFKFDPETGQYTDYGEVKEKQEYTRTAYYNGHLYVGYGTTGGIAKLNLDTGEKADIELPDEFDSMPISTVQNIDTAGKYLFAGLNGDLYIYDMEQEEWLDQSYPGYKGLRLARGPEGSNKVYFMSGTDLMEFDLTTLTARDTEVDYPTYIRNSAWVEVKDDPDLPGLSLATPLLAGGVSYLNLETKTAKSIRLPIEGQPVEIRVMEKGPDGALYMSGYPGGSGSKFDPAAGTITRFDLGQAEGMVALGDHMYFGMYPGAELYVMDVYQGTEVTKLFSVGQGEDRPFILTTGEGKVFMGTIPTYGQLGGGLTIYNLETGDWQTFHHVIHHQSIVGLAYRDGKLYGSTSVDGGEGIDPSETEAKMFVWDLATNQKTAEFVPELPGALTMPDMISGLTFGPDGLLWGAADGIIFAMDPDTFDIVKSKVIYPGVSFYGKWQPVYSRWGDDGLLYTTLAGRLTVIDPDTLEHVDLAQTPVMALGDDGHIYFRTEGTTLAKIEVSDGWTVSPISVSVNVYNPSFEMPAENGKIPGWNLQYLSSNASYEVSKERSYSGKYSLKLTDPSQTDTVSLLSDNIPVLPGVEYNVRSKVFLEEGRAILSYQFYNEAGEPLNGGSSVYIDSGRGQWREVEVRATAPEEAKYAKVQAWISQFYTGTVYYDDITVTYTADGEMIDPAFTQEMIDQFTASGQLRHPLATSLSNLIKQVQHHVERGRMDQAADHLETYLDLLNNRALQRYVDLEAKKVLEDCAYHMIVNWSKW